MILLVEIFIMIIITFFQRNHFLCKKTNEKSERLLYNGIQKKNI